MVTASERPALRALAAIVDLPVRVGAVAKRARTQPEAFVAELESLLTASALGSTADADAMLACAVWLLDQGEARVSELHAIAVREGHALVTAMLTDAAAHRGLAPGGRLPQLGIPETARVVEHVFAQSDGGDWRIDGVDYDPPLRPRSQSPPAPGPQLETADDHERYFATLLERIAAEPYAWRPMPPMAVRRAVTRLGQHHSAFTIGRLLDSPSTRERDVIAIAARRPTTPAIVRQLTSRPRWMLLPNVRAALVANPCTPTRVALLLSVTCVPRLRSIAASNVHPSVRELACLVTGRRRRSENTAA